MPVSVLRPTNVAPEDSTEDPWERLSAKVQGDIVHRVLERSHRERRRCGMPYSMKSSPSLRTGNVPEGYRTEAVRLELLHNLELMESDPRLARGSQSLYEEQFTLKLDEGVFLKGKVDRIEVDAHGNATVIDYKYRSKQGTDRTKKGHEENTSVQGGLYLLAAEGMGYKPAGMVYCGMKREVHMAGWMLSPHYPEIKQACEPEELTW